MLVKLTYFKRSGKLYTSGTYLTACEHMFEIYREVALKRVRGELPDLAPHHQMNCTVLVEAPEHKYNVPQLIGADDANEILQDILKLGADDRHAWDPHAEFRDRARKIGVIE